MYLQNKHSMLEFSCFFTEQKAVEFCFVFCGVWVDCFFERAVEVFRALFQGQVVIFVLFLGLARKACKHINIKFENRKWKIIN